MKPPLLQDDHYVSGQSWCMVRIYKVDNRRYRVNIRRNAYDEQSYGDVEVWTPTSGWCEVMRRQVRYLACRAVNYTDTDGKRKLFETDADHLLTAACRVVEDV